MICSAQVISFEIMSLNSKSLTILKIQFCLHAEANIYILLSRASLTSFYYVKCIKDFLVRLSTEETD